MKLIDLLHLVMQLIMFTIKEAAERQKAGNLEAIQAAADQSDKARTKDEAINAAKALREALKKR